MTDDARTPGPDDRPHYNAAREAFDKLDPRDKAAFLLESAFGAAGEVFAGVAREVADVIDRAGRGEFWNADPIRPDPFDPSDPGAPPAPPPPPRPGGRRRPPPPPPGPLPGDEPTPGTGSNIDL